MNIEFNKDARLVINGVVFDIAPENELKVILEIAKIEKGAMLFRPLYKYQWESDLNAMSQFLIEEIEKYQEYDGTFSSQSKYEILSILGFLPTAIVKKVIYGLDPKLAARILDDYVYGISGTNTSELEKVIDLEDLAKTKDIFDQYGSCKELSLGHLVEILNNLKPLANYCDVASINTLARVINYCAIDTRQKDFGDKVLRSLTKIEQYIVAEKLTDTSRITFSNQLAV